MACRMMDELNDGMDERTDKQWIARSTNNEAR